MPAIILPAEKHTANVHEERVIKMWSSGSNVLSKNDYNANELGRIPFEITECIYDYLRANGLDKVGYSERYTELAEFYNLCNGNDIYFLSISECIAFNNIKLTENNKVTLF